MKRERGGEGESKRAKVRCKGGERVGERGG